MNIFEVLSFDIMDFVTSTPGILIIAGIVLLIIALIILSTGKKKNVEENTQVVEAERVPEATVNSTVHMEQVPVQGPAVTPMVDTAVEVTTAPVEPLVLNANAEPAVETNSILEPEVLPAENMPVEELPAAPTFEEPKVNDNVVINPDFSVPAVENIEPTLSSDNAVYGGVSPIVSDMPAVEEAPRPIYGGANPLENTAPVPVFKAPEAYAGTPTVQEPVQEVAPDLEPMVEETVETPAVNMNNEVTRAPLEETKVEAPSEEIETLEF